MSEQTDILVKFIAESLKEGKDFALNQAPEVVQQYILYAYYDNFLGLLLGLLLLIFGIWYFRLAQKLEEEDLISINIPFGFIIGLFSCVISIIFIIISTQYLVMVHFAPKVFLLKEVSKLIIK